MKKFIEKSGTCRASLLQKEEVQAFQKKFSGYHNHVLEVAEYTKALSDPTRCKIITLLFLFEALCVCDVANILEISIASASQHLRKLKNLQFIASEKRGQTVFYQLEKDSPFGLFCSKILIL